MTRKTYEEAYKIMQEISEREEQAHSLMSAWQEVKIIGNKRNNKQMMQLVNKIWDGILGEKTMNVIIHEVYKCYCKRIEELKKELEAL